MNINDHNPLPPYLPSTDRYAQMKYRRTGKSGLLLPEISLGLWHNFGHNADFTLGRKILRRAFDLGISHFDLANNYGPPYGSAEENFGRILKKDFLPYRDELIISSKAGWDMWPGPYGNMGSKKYLVASCDQSLKRMGLDYVDIFYHHRPDPETPLEETMGALDLLVRQGKALYVGISQYSAEDTARAYKILKELGTPLLIHQPRYSMMDRWVEDGLLDVLGENGIGSIAFSPLEQGMLTDKYLKGIPEDSRAAKDGRYLKPEQIGGEKLEQIRQLNEVAISRGQTLAQMAIAWLLKDSRITSVLVGVSKPEQLDDNVNAVKNTQFSEAEVSKIKGILGSK
ncbi:MAG TPA: L-glyceraldehyde 3-phosphate reductase [Algoriphagus sp.]|jgi:L-glyceraldehyde 3-phosphate reductase|uniref:L-glyceraldehyde 3-phosphate reductase n=2 Tax=Cyclobacteriaceae TaxID=563798 RepID=UPI000C523993|nr:MULTISPECIES: L-glyceraldehyde 3-phosphate reductase [Algoriphagus]MAL14512.1 L-glyceraldehyde 3-phosphate reductase [Algoriphagus sp.]MAN85310.1 L-glyceraldehyde 3-phosphate reductase [Algoriphagus sp.]QYH38164.1 L-glyceraldehyde 3-phosphate reductase [Algoriphagus sp. NBT04N3]HAD52803.1 L-glyceraldehyde 3-phosphate reductase [Algoriphagus sp.]HAH38008.1 L-glyceraldehyde 3-phosphate reductase [Algoriphagus sp.]|tara:strand:+ start:8138 stop:9160 length:1023 start_codon:yes stop_codon:yes gene_type:complete